MKLAGADEGFGAGPVSDFVPPDSLFVVLVEDEGVYRISACWFALAGSGSHPVDGLAFEDSDEPGLDGGPTLESVPCSERGEEGFLNEFFGDGVVSDAAEGETEQNVAVQIDPCGWIQIRRGPRLFIRLHDGERLPLKRARQTGWGRELLPGGRAAVYFAGKLDEFDSRARFRREENPMKIRTMTAFPILMLSAFALPGCKTAKEVVGTYEMQLKATPPEIVAAAEDAMKELELEVDESRSSQLDGIVTAKTAQGQEIKVSVKREGDDDSRISVRVGALGDAGISNTILEKTKKKLED